MRDVIVQRNVFVHRDDFVQRDDLVSVDNLVQLKTKDSYGLIQIRDKLLWLYSGHFYRANL